MLSNNGLSGIDDWPCRVAATGFSRRMGRFFGWPDLPRETPNRLKNKMAQEVQRHYLGDKELKSILTT
jgi:hypothetical protein